MRTATTVAALTLVMLAASMPTTNAVDLAVQAPLLAVVQVELPEGPQARPRPTVSPGWACVESVPWEPRGEVRAFELSCVPKTGTEHVVEWRCQHPAVLVEAGGVGTVTGTSYCDGVGASCTAVAPAPGRCGSTTFGSGAPPLRCRIDVSGFVTSWRVTCYNDP